MAGREILKRAAAGTEQGFTLIELMFVIAIAALLVRLAVPSFSKSIHDNHVVTATNGLLAGFNLAKTTAIQRGKFAIICATDNPNNTTPSCGSNWANGWIIYTADAANGTPTSSTLVKVGSKVDGVVVTSTTASALAFTKRGLVDSTTGVGTLEVKSSPCASGKDKVITITLNASGRAYTTAATATSVTCP